MKAPIVKFTCPNCLGEQKVLRNAVKIDGDATERNRENLELYRKELAKFREKYPDWFGLSEAIINGECEPRRPDHEPERYMQCVLCDYKYYLELE